MLGCFNSNVGQIWTEQTPKIGLKMEFHILTQLQVSLSAVFDPNLG